MRRITTTVMMIVLIAAFAGCRSSYITSTWQNDKSKKSGYRKILVVGLIRDTDRRLQENMEEHMAGDLRAMGYEVITSLAEFGPKAFENKTEKEVLKELEEKNIDGVVTIVLLDKSKERVFVPNTPNMLGNFVNYYNYMYGRIESPGYWVTDTKYFWESNLYDLRTKEHQYSVQTESFDPASTQQMAHEYGLMIVKDMKKKKVVGTPATQTKGF